MEAIYLDTTFISKVLDKSRDPVSIYFNKITNLWWNENKDAFQFYISEAVLDELSEGIYPHKLKSINFAKKIPRLALNEQIIVLAEKFIELKIMPKTGLDSLHLAYATFYSIDHLISLNYKHLVNENKIKILEKVSLKFGYKLPRITSPERFQSGKNA